jgi:hypothetical protein
MFYFQKIINSDNKQTYTDDEFKEDLKKMV